ncbi:MAG: SCO family protein [Deltaproteobacteria bacterium]|nr:SCO family protein [Deltaproteobacteria bacterium]
MCAPYAQAASSDHMAHDHSGQTHDMSHEDSSSVTEKVHIHPSSGEESSDSVGLDERLGKKIPLELSFYDEQGQTVMLADLVNKPTIIAPIYYRCPNVCHFLQGDLARALPQLKLTGGEDYQVLSISFDETETPELAKRSRDTYYAAMNTDYPPQAWRFLTGERDAIMALTSAAGFRFQRVGSDFLHPVVFFVVTSDGQIVRYLHGTHVLPKDLTLALFEAKDGRVGSTIRKVVQFCFSFDPDRKTYVFNVLRVSATVILVTLGAFLGLLVLSGKKSKRGPKL